MRTLEAIFKSNTGPMITRHNHVLNIYDELFSRYRGKEVSILEIGIAAGGSLLMWRDYFGEKAKVYGLDISEAALGVVGGQIKVFTGDQSDRAFLKRVVEEVGHLDIVIDDGSHDSAHQIASFEEIFPCLNDNGMYAIEDLHTSYRENYGGGLRDPKSIVEYTKNFIDYFHCGELSQEERHTIPNYIRSVYGIHYYRNVLIVDKNTKYSDAQSPVMTGAGTVKYDLHEITGWRFDV